MLFLRYIRKTSYFCFQDARADITNRTLYIDNRGQTVSSDELPGTAYSSYTNEASRTWFSPDDDANEFESIRILGNAHVALHPDLTRYLQRISLKPTVSIRYILFKLKKNHTCILSIMIFL